MILTLSRFCNTPHSQPNSISVSNIILRSNVDLECYQSGFKLFDRGNRQATRGYTRFVGVSYQGVALGQRVFHILGNGTCDTCDSSLTILLSSQSC